MRNDWTRLGRYLALALLPLLPWSAQGQSINFFNRPAVNAFGVAPLEIYAQDRDVLQIHTGAEIEYRSNVFALPGGESPAGIFGSSSRSDTALKALLGVSFDRQVSLQRLRFDASLIPVKFLEYSEFDHLAHSAGAHWDWAVGRPWFGTLGARLTRGLTPFGTYFQNVKNMEDRNRLYGSGAMRFTPSWAAFLGLDLETLRNSFAGVQAADYDFVSTETGLRYAPGTGTEIDLVWRRTNGEYPNRQVFDAAGNLLPVTVDNEFDQDTVFARLQVRPSDDSRLAGRIGYAKRRFETLSGRDFGGIVGGLNVDWRPTGATTMRVDLLRDIQSEEVLTASYVDVLTLALRPTMRLTGKTVLRGLLSFSNRDYEGDPGFAAALGAVRKDEVTVLGIGVGWEVARNIEMNFDARRNERKSNYARFSFTDDVFMVNLLARF